MSEPLEVFFPCEGAARSTCLSPPPKRFHYASNNRLKAKVSPPVPNGYAASWSLSKQFNVFVVSLRGTVQMLHISHSLKQPPFASMTASHTVGAFSSGFTRKWFYQQSCHKCSALVGCFSFHSAVRLIQNHFSCGTWTWISCVKPIHIGKKIKASKLATKVDTGCHVDTTTFTRF